MPTRWHETPNGRFKVSTPELTAVDLVSRQQVAGGISRVFDVLQSLIPDISADGLTAALDATQETPTAQRLGVLLSRLDQPLLANLVTDWLGTRRTRRIPLAIGGDEQGASTLERRFKVKFNLFA